MSTGWRLMAGLLPALVAALVLSVVGAAVVAWLGRDVGEVASQAVQSTLMQGYGVGQVLFRATPLILTGLAVAVPLQAGLFNIGAEGQLVAGGLACAAVAGLVPAEHGMTAALLATLAAAAAGAGAGAVTGVLRASRGVHEVISTIMLNFVLTALCGWLLHAGLAEAGTTHTPELAPGILYTRLSNWLEPLRGSLVSTSLLGAVGLAALMQVVVWRSPAGLEWRAVGGAPRTAAWVGVSTPRVMVLALTVGGALSGAAGAHFVLGARRFFEEGMSGGEGFLGIAVALLARSQLMMVVPAALVFAVLQEAGLAVGALVPRELVVMLQGLAVLCLAVGEPWSLHVTDWLRTRVARGGHD